MIELGYREVNDGHMGGLCASSQLNRPKLGPRYCFLFNVA